MKLIKRNGFFDDWFKAPFTSFVRRNDLQTNLKIEDDKYVFEIEVPGLKKDDIKLSLEDGYLTIDVEKKESQESKGNYVRKESYYGRMSRSFYVGNVEENEVNAKCKKGILYIEIPREETEEVKKNYIEIK